MTYRTEKGESSVEMRQDARIGEVFREYRHLNTAIV